MSFIYSEIYSIRSLISEARSGHSELTPDSGVRSDISAQSPGILRNVHLDEFPNCRISDSSALAQMLESNLIDGEYLWVAWAIDSSPAWILEDLLYLQKADSKCGKNDPQAPQKGRRL